MKIKNLFNKATNNKGFTLVELIVVIVIIAILIAALAPVILGAIRRANRVSDEADARNVLTAAAVVVLDFRARIPAQTGDNNFQELMERELIGGNFTPGALFTVHFKENFPVTVVLTTNARTDAGATVGQLPVPTGDGVVTRTFTAP